jgi:hypothetical protein
MKRDRDTGFSLAWPSSIMIYSKPDYDKTLGNVMVLRNSAFALGVCPLGAQCSTARGVWLLSAQRPARNLRLGPDTTVQGFSHWSRMGHYNNVRRPDECSVMTDADRTVVQ